MDIVYDILLTTGKILFFVLTIVAFVVSGTILFKPGTAGNFNAKFNAWFSTEQISDEADTHVDTHQTVMKYRWLVGGLFFLGALYTVKYLLMDFNQAKFVGLVIAPGGGTARLFAQIAVETIKYFMVIVSLMGIVVCLIIMFKPDTFQQMNNRMDQAFSTKGIQDRLDTSRTSFDKWVLDNHVFVGSFLFLGSIFMLVFILTRLI